ncbi:MAG: prolyl oligopeptidase family serine peptidase [Bacteroidetes bacterium]|nr:prolyl oligopeptidase family serine peptidase [Bacteroidota bacterium]
MDTQDEFPVINVQYPETKKVPLSDEYFGVKVEDPYQWLEDDKSNETAEWVKAQNEITFDYLGRIPFRDQIRERLKTIWDYPKYGVPFRKADLTFFFKNDGVQNQAVFYVQSGSDSARVLLDPNTLSEDGTVALGDVAPSEDGKYLAYSINRAGSDWAEIYVLDIATGVLLDDHLMWVKFSNIAWHGNGFFYSRYDAPTGSELSSQNENHKIYFHKTATPQTDDKLIFTNPDSPKRNYTAEVTDDHKYLCMYESETTSGNAFYIKDLDAHGFVFKKVADGFDFEYKLITAIEGKLLVYTSDNAQKYKAVLIDPKNPDRKNWKDFIPEKEDVLQGMTRAGDKLVALYMKDASSKAFVYSLDGKMEKEVELPALGTVAGVSGDKAFDSFYYGFTSFTYPTTIFNYNLENGENGVFYKPQIQFNPDDYETKQIFYKSKDGTDIPMFIVHKKGIKLDGKNPTLLYGYGGFNVSLTPSFSTSRIILLENGGIYALANIRGGGEYGEAWHIAGTKLKKQNVFDDFIAAAEFLIKEKYTSSEKLGIMGGSNGGLLVGACMTQRPDLFKVAFPQVGVLDMLKFHKFTIGWAWVGDYGSSEESEEMFKYLLGYSPLHNLKSGTEYPATLITTGDHDDRVVPAHSFKFAAALQANHKGDNPVLIRIETNAGHGAGKPTDKQIEEAADTWTFLFYNLKVKPKF